MARYRGRVIPSQLAQSINAQISLASKPVRLFRPGGTVPVEAYTRKVRTPIPDGYGAATIGSDGTATVTVGPQGVGSIWYAINAAGATSSGILDGSTCQIYMGPQGEQSLVNGIAPLAGGSFSIGLGGPALYPGSFIVAKWTGGKSGDLATLAVYGTLETLIQ